MAPRRAALWAVAFWLAACAGAGDLAPAEPASPLAIRVAASPVWLDPTDESRRQLGGLVFRGGLELTSTDNRFGGWSDLRVGDDGRLFAISDQSHWLDARIVLGSFGEPRALAGARMGSLIDPGGRKVVGFAGDAEGLALLPDGSTLVSFERRHRIWRYPRAEPPFSRSPEVFAAPPGLSQAPSNGGIEALAALAGGRILALAEGLREDGGHVGWLWEQGRWSGLHYRAAEGFDPTAAAELPGGDVLVLERSVSIVAGWRARIVRVAARDVAAGATLSGREIARLDAPLTRDNFEGVAVARGARGETLVYLISDDNYRGAQRTLLMLFELAE